ncbi:hypothetical protein CXB49_12005 [Chromobacterium sp. ATCC 53434]|uniref:hypothetical protein n=1 Tax=Chromobacterium sp. (strain ATCC 53434 / SC 14030) TaxID=2059672 RepID=UPI000C794FE0|nr:hypothetical protein [Chromobacterium sp. ATCC 53434]AUH51491.1 hypothetical protein CXB49_12005 [Chromobacterium sp. ATCC 53434]
MTTIFDAFDNFMKRLPKIRGAALWDKCAWTTGSGPVITLRGGGLMTVYKLDGALQSFDGEAYRERLAKLAAMLASLPRRNGIVVDIVFQRDKETSRKEVKKQANSIRSATARIGMDVNFILDEREDILSRTVASEIALIVVTTSPSILPKEMRKVAANWSGGEMAQSETFIPAMRNRHQGVCKEYVEGLVSIFSLKARALTLEEAIVMDANLWDGGGEGLRPITPDSVKQNGAPPARAEPAIAGQRDDIVPPLPGLQIFRRQAENMPEEGVARTGNRYYSSGYFEFPISQPEGFNNLLRILPTARIHAEIPFRMAFQLLSGSASGRFSTKKSVAQFLKFSTFGGQNSKIVDAINEVKELEKSGVTTFVGVRISVATWGASKQEATDRFTELAAALNGWGGGQVIQEFGNPCEVAIGTLPGFRNLAPELILPAQMLAAILPIERPASPWNYGNMMMLTEDGKLFVYQVGSQLQQAWVDVMFATMGSGKSVLLQALNLGSILQPGKDDIPRMAILDVGYSSKGLIDTVKASLPPDREYLAQHYRLSIDKRNAMNPFDTMLGCRAAVPDEKAFLVDFVTLLLTPVGQDRPVPEIAELVDTLVAAAYRYFSIEKPKKYQPRRNQEVDEALQRNNLHPDEGASWWSIVDMLFERGEIRCATVAQRYAVPIIPDLSQVMQATPSIKDNYTDAVIPGGSSMLDFCNRMLGSISSRFPLLAYETALDFANAKIVAVDLADVTGGQGAASQKQGEVMYLATSAFLARGYYMDDDVVPTMDCPGQYMEYHRRELRKNRNEVKRIVYDELHNISSPMVLGLIETLVRVGRKYKVHIALASQEHTDFPKSIMNLATNIWVLRADSKEVREDLKKSMDLSEYAEEALANRIQGLTPLGAPMLLYSKIKGAIVERVLYFKPGGVELWAYATTPANVEIRGQVAKFVGYREALSRLARRFPGGDAVSEVDKRIDAWGGAKREADIIKEIVAEVAGGR